MFEWVERLALWRGFEPDLQTLLMYGVGVAAYTALVYAFYQNISRRDPFHFTAHKGFWGKLQHGAETALTFPLLSFGYFATLSLALFLLTKARTDTATILLLAMSVVVGVRFTAHMSESMSNDLAKLLPLSLLAVVVVDPGYLSLTLTFQRVGEAFQLWPVLARYFVVFIVFEAVLRALRAVVPGFKRLVKWEIRHHKLSKKALLKDAGAAHDKHAVFHGPRGKDDRFLTLDDSTGGKPGSRQGVGPAIQREIRAHHERAHANRPRAGPGG